MVDSVALVPRDVMARYPRARFLSEAEQERYEESVRNFVASNYPPVPPAINSLSPRMNGSNPWKVLLLNQIGIKTASIQKLDLLGDINPKFLEGFLVDVPAVILRSPTGRNEYLAKKLAELVGITNFEVPHVIEGLEPEYDQNSPYGLSFKRGEQFRVIQAPDFSHKNHGEKFRKINPDYSIDFDKNGSKILFTRSDGLSGLYLVWSLGVSSDYEYLALSNAYSRVVVIDSP